VAPWAVEEFAWFCEQVKKGLEQGLDEKGLSRQIKDQAEAMRQALAKGLISRFPGGWQHQGY